MSSLDYLCKVVLSHKAVNFTNPVWTDEEVRLLLENVNNFKLSNGNINWKLMKEEVFH